jgi:alpha-L-fucosidase 2
LPTSSFQTRAQYVIGLAKQFGGWAYPGDLSDRFTQLQAQIGQGKDFTVLLPAEQYAMKNNVENPELYSVFPYGIYGVGKPDLQLARDTFAVRMHPDRYCWYQNGIQAALLGLTEEAVRDVTERASKNFTKQCRFPAMFDANYDSIPDIDHGGGLQSTLQRMLMQCEGRRILLLPAWPKGWDADFKLHAPMQTTVEGKVRNGKIGELVVTPAKRMNDIVYP